jgi:acetyl/propionyl-CoA carboxylase alpha subunit
VSPRALRGLLRLGDLRTEVDVRLEDGRLVGRLGSGAEARAVDVPVARAPDGTLTLAPGGREVRARAARLGEKTFVAIAGRSFEVEREEPGARVRGGASREAFAASPMTGLVAKVGVAPGERVAAGTALFVVEAMKMEYAVKAPRDLTVADVRRKAGERVALGEVVVTFAESP